MSRTRYCFPIFIVHMLLLVAVQFFSSGLVHAAEETDGKLNYAFASYVGTGVYTTSGQSAQIYNIPFELEIYEADEGATRLFLTLPVAVGFVDFERLDIFDEGLPSKVSTASFIPGLRLEQDITDFWKLAPKADWGMAKNFTSGEAVHVYSFELVNRLKLAFKAQSILFETRILYAKHGGSSDSGADDFASLEAMLGLPGPFSLGKEIELMPYYANFRYFDDLKFLRPGEDPVRVGIQSEVGITIRIPIPLLGKKKRTLGIGYRFGDNLDVFRLVLGRVI